ncbi:MoaD/ThiS family protein [Cellulomonas sp. PhB150]|uniref:MoaD/ThiS family protein n=1 Tax=Cellulomonas sp. PhB150 TaxID=2485188 RepID=UPI000F46DE40|nr:MoaD/ThiS family protein [Cellulomonas sp. PhB150]ROS26167.1 molybdopterin converting factor small subunit [Cellulomonas sp. PhB150]
MITVRYFAAAAEAAGVDTEQVAAGSAGEVAAALVARHPALGAVLGRCALLADGVRVEGDGLVAAGATLDVLPPFAGG